MVYVKHSLPCTKFLNMFGQEGTRPVLSPAWEVGSWSMEDTQKAKNRSKGVKDIAKRADQAVYRSNKTTAVLLLVPIIIYKLSWEASLIYEDTPWINTKATVDVKEILEKDCPMDRLICGDVGFGKNTSGATKRAAFKRRHKMDRHVCYFGANNDIGFAALQTFFGSFEDFPVDIDYVSRFRTMKKNQILKKTQRKEHLRLLSDRYSLLNKKETEFKDLGLLIADENKSLV